MWLILLAGIALSGCGESGLAEPGSSSGSITKARAVAFARTVNLRATDLPSFENVGLAPEPQPKTNTSDPEFARCVGVRPTRYLASIQSPGFIRGRFRTRAELVTSKVIVLPTASLAAHDLTTLTTAGGRSCFAHLLVRPESMSSTESHLHIGRVSWSSPALPPAAHGFKVRAAGTLIWIHARNRPIRLYIDMLGFIDGPAQIYLLDTSWESPARSSVERRLLSLLYRRAEAHRL